LRKPHCGLIIHLGGGGGGGGGCGGGGGGKSHPVAWKGRFPENAHRDSQYWIREGGGERFPIRPRKGKKEGKEKGTSRQNRLTSNVKKEPTFAKERGKSRDPENEKEKKEKQEGVARPRIFRGRKHHRRRPLVRKASGTLHALVVEYLSMTKKPNASTA